MSQILFMSFLTGIFANVAYALESKSEVASNADVQACVAQLKQLPIQPPKINLEEICALARKHPQCTSTKGAPIFHFDFNGTQSKLQDILVFALIHGDEVESGSISLRWIQRLKEINSRNRWRIVPILNPDGLASRKRTNANGVDLNRNFPSQEWSTEAPKYWAKLGKNDPRKFPGTAAASEVETRCAMELINEYRPSFIVSVHTPYGVLDFDGPKVAFPNFKHLPWVTLGTFPGSLGRYMWKDQNVPVLTIELKDDKLFREMDQVDLLQDISGTVAIRSNKKVQKAN